MCKFDVDGIIASRSGRSQKSRLLVALLTAVPLVSTVSAEAARFGKQETIHFLQDVPLKGPKEEALYLGYMTAIENFLAGVYVQDEGYVLGVKGDSKKYYPMPSREKLTDFQQHGLLPNALPKYSLSIKEYLLGYSLWIIIPVVVLVMWLRQRRKRT